MALNVNNLKMTGIKKAAGETKSLNGYNGYVEIAYDYKQGKVYSTYFPDMNSYSLYASSHIIDVANARRPMTMQHIAALIRGRMYKAELRGELRC